MSWIQKLCEAYDANILCNQSDEAKPLVPLGFIRKEVKYHVVLTQAGEFVSADEFPKGTFQQIPSTPQAETRTGKHDVPFPLTEQLKYLIYDDQNANRFTQYMEQLHAWCQQPNAPRCLQAVYTYLEKHTLLQDLEAAQSLKLQYYKNPETREGVGSDAKVMLCFSVQMPDGDDNLCFRQDVRESWQQYFTKLQSQQTAFCYVKGQVLPARTKHQKLYGNAKLISAEDTNFPFLYKGRFTADDSAASVSAEASICAHNALLWLMERQGLQKYGMKWVVWNTNNIPMQVPIADINIFFPQLSKPTQEANTQSVEEPKEESDEKPETPTTSKPVIHTFETYAHAVRLAALGYGNHLKDDFREDLVHSVCILSLEAATPGRMSITYYQELPGNTYVERLENWYLDCCWFLYNKVEKCTEILTPTATQIANTVIGTNNVNTADEDIECKKSGTKWMRQLQSRILICIIDQQPLPLDIVRSAFHRVCMPFTFTNTNENNKKRKDKNTNEKNKKQKDKKWSRFIWEQNVNTACALISCFQKRTQTPNDSAFQPKPELDCTISNRDYLYGRLLAIADKIESEGMERKTDEPTHAIRLMQQFMQQPFITWQKIHEKLMPSFKKLGKQGNFYFGLLEQIEGLFAASDRYSETSLSFAFLQGFSSQSQAFFQKDKIYFSKEASPHLPYTLPIQRSALYGCLLAIADTVQWRAAGEEKIGMTHAIQMMPTFAAKPSETWSVLHDKLLPYLEKLRQIPQHLDYQKLIGMVEQCFTQSDRESDAPLDSSYLHGYYRMRYALYHNQIKMPTDLSAWHDSTQERSALYGQLLGIAERIERNYFFRKFQNSEYRSPNALRFMAAFSQKPAAGWENLKRKITPFLRYLPHANTQLESLEHMLFQAGWNTNTPLHSIYLHYYYQTRND